MDKKIFIIIVTFNSKNYIEKCLSSINKSSLLEIIIVDNASDDNTIDIIQNKFPEIKLFKLAKNLGFGRANNIGIKYAYENDAEQILLLNQDAYIESKTIIKISKLMKENLQYGILSPIHLNNKKKKLDSQFAYHISESHDKDSLFSDFFLNHDKKEIYTVNFVNASVWMISRECIKKVGLFNPAFFHYGEDNEYVERVKYFGLKIGIASECYAIHDRNHILFSEKKYRKYLQYLRSTIIRKLSRLQMSNLRNIFGVLFIIFYAKLPNISILKKFEIKFKLLIFFLINFKKSIINRKIALQGKLSFYRKADLDCLKYLKVPKKCI